jgi:hypothetical protein
MPAMGSSLERDEREEGKGERGCSLGGAMGGHGEGLLGGAWPCCSCGSSACASLLSVPLFCS